MIPVQVGLNKLLADGTVETLACEIGPQGEALNARLGAEEEDCEENI